MNHQTIYLAVLGALLVLLVIDWRQTLAIAGNPAKWYERNPALGKHPTPARVHAWFAAVMLATALAAWLLRGLPEVFCAGAFAACVAELVCVVNNWRLGIPV